MKCRVLFVPRMNFAAGVTAESMSLKVNDCERFGVDHHAGCHLLARGRAANRNDPRNPPKSRFATI